MGVIGWRGSVLRSVVAPVGLSASLALAGEAGPPPLAREQVEAGRLVYQQSCASCHGSQGKVTANWEEPNALGNLPPPPHDADGHTWKHSDAMLYRMVSEGWRDPFNKTEELTMPAFKSQLSPDQIRHVISYLKTLWTSEQRQFQWEETQVRGGFQQSPGSD